MPESPFRVRKFLIVFIIAWVILMADHGLLLYWFDFSLEASLIDSAISNITLLCTCLMLMNSIRYYVPDVNQYRNVLVMCIIFTLLWLLLSKWLLSLTLGVYDNYQSFLARTLVIRGSVGFLILGVMTMTVIIWYNLQEQQVT